MISLRDLTSYDDRNLPPPPGLMSEKAMKEQGLDDLHGTGVSWNLLMALYAYPHYLGRLVGKTLLTALHSQWILDCWYGPKGVHFSHQAHRGAYKTTAETEVGPAHYFFTGNVGDRIALVRENFQVAAESLATIVKIMANEDYRTMFLASNGVLPNMVIARSDAMLLECKPTITKEHNLMAFGIETIKTGSHFDIIHCDDIITINDRLSKAKRERTIQGIIEIRTNIIDPGKTCHFVGTPWHPEDGWKNCPEPIKDSVYTTGVLTEEQIEEKKKLTTPSLWAANYELKHMADESNIFKERAFIEPWNRQHPYLPVAHLDAKFSGSHTGALTIMSRLRDGRVQIHGKIFHDHVKDCMDDIKRICNRFGVVQLYIELNADKGFVADELEKPTRSGVPGIHIGTDPEYGGRYTERTNKHVKIVTYGLKWWDKLVWDPDTDEEYISQVLDYMEGQEPDDAPDSMASLLRQYFDEGRMGNMAMYE